MNRFILSVVMATALPSAAIAQSPAETEPKPETGPITYQPVQPQTRTYQPAQPQTRTYQPRTYQPRTYQPQNGQIAPSTPVSPQPVTGARIATPAPNPIPAGPYINDYSAQINGQEGPVPVITDPRSCVKGTQSVRITVQNVKKSEGYIVADVHNDVKEDWLKGDKVVLRIRAKAQKGETSFCIPIRTAGEYAIALYHDKNDNKKFDKGFLGIPKERFAMSNNPKFGTKSPKYEKAAFTVPVSGVDMSVEMKSASDVL